MPDGGIAPTLSLRITFSQVSAFAGMFATSIFSSVKPPVLARSLWQVTQYLSSRARCGKRREAWSERTKLEARSWPTQAIAKPTFFLIIRTLCPYESYTK